MPIVNVECLIENDTDRYDGDSVQALADALGDLFESEPGTTWVKMFYLSRDDYAENRATLDPEDRPVMVEVLKRSLPDQQALSGEADQIASIVADVLSRPRDNVHVIYLREGAGRVAFGGKLIPKE